jgi:hypothetical protein
MVVIVTDAAASPQIPAYFNAALHLTHNKACRIRQTARVTPAMQAGLTDHAQESDDLVAILD